MSYNRLSLPIWFAFFAHASVILVAAILAEYLPPHPPLGFINPLLDTAPPFIEKFIRWDAHWYTYVAAAGYTEQSIVFFPLIIILIRAANFLGLSITVAGFFRLQSICRVNLLAAL